MATPHNPDTAGVDSNITVAPEAPHAPSGASNPLAGPEPQNAPSTAASGPHSPHGEASTDQAPAAVRTARQKIAALLWWSVPSSTDEEAKQRTEELLDEHRAEVLREAERKAREIVARLWGDGTTQQQLDRAGGARAVEWEIGLMVSGNDEPTAVPDFFQPGHTYTRQHHAETIRFFVECVSTSPDGCSRAAHGWRTRDWDTGSEPTDFDDFTGWTDVTTVYPVGGENAQETSR